MGSKISNLLIYAQFSGGARRSRRFNVAGKRGLEIHRLLLLFSLKRHECRAPQ
jgi:hypothetical protein